MTEYIIKGTKVLSSKNEMIEKLLNDNYGYNHICKCGNEQTASSLYNILKYTHTIDNDYVCRDCIMSRPVEYMGKSYSSIKSAADILWNEDMKCPRCGSPISYGAFYQKIQRGWSMECHSCISSDTRTELNKIYHEDLSKAIAERNYKNWNDPDYYKSRQESARETIRALWNSQEKKYGPDGSMTFSELRSWHPSKDGPGNIFNSEFMYNLWSDLEYRKSAVAAKSSNDFKSYFCTQFRTDVSSRKDWYSGIYPKLQKDYEDMYGPIDLTCIPNELMIIPIKFSSINLESNYYLDYCIKNELVISPYGNHHVFPKSITEINNESCKMSVDIKTHSILHYLMVLDNLDKFSHSHDTNFESLFYKLVGGLMARYNLGYIKYLNAGSLTESNNQLTPYLIEVIEELFC